jgi:hypothetical protein
LAHSASFESRDKDAPSKAGTKQLRAISPLVRIAISQKAFDSIAATLPFGRVGYENEVDANGARLIWLPPDFIAKLRYLRGPGESYSDVILRLGEAG